jgi:hypothetical protein
MDDELIVLACSDRELFALLNDSLPVGERVSYRSFQRYKAHAMACGTELEDCETEEEIATRDGFDPVYRTMYNLFTLALIKQKKALLHRILDEEQGWRRYQWLLERKYREWNLRWEPEEVPSIPIQEAPEPEAEKLPELAPNPQPWPERLIAGKISEKVFDAELEQWMAANNIVPAPDEIIEYRCYTDRPNEFRLVRVGRDKVVSKDETVEEHYYYYEAGHNYGSVDGMYTVRIIPPARNSKAA